MGVLFALFDMVGVQFSYTGWLDYSNAALLLSFSVVVHSCLFVFGSLLFSVLIRDDFQAQITFYWLSFVLIITNALIPLFQSWSVLSSIEKSGLIVLYFIFVAMAYLNVRFWFRRTFVHETMRPELWRSLSLGLCIFLLCMGAGLLQQKNSFSYGYDGDPPVYLVTIRNWSSSDFQKMPRTRGHLEKCDQYTQAISPHSEDVPALASILTGMHPLSIGLWSNKNQISSKNATIAKYFAQERYETAAFVSHQNTDSFVRRFQISDTKERSFLVGLPKLSFFRLFSSSFWGVRSDFETITKALSFSAAKKEESFFSWIQLNGGEATDLDATLSYLFEQLFVMHPQARIALVGVQGRSFGVQQEALQVPLLFCAPSTTGVLQGGLVRTIDVLNTLLARVPIKNRTEIDGAELFSFRNQDDFAGFTTIVLGRASEEGAPNSALVIFAVTQNQKDVYKYIYAQEKEFDQLYHISDDPKEKSNIREEKPQTAMKIRQQADSVWQIVHKGKSE